MLKNFDELKGKIQSDNRCFKVALWGADEPGWLKVLGEFRKDGKIEAILIGEKEKVLAAAKERAVDPSFFEIFKSSSPAESKNHIKNLLQGKKLDILIRGNTGIRDSLQALMARDVGFRAGKGLISGISCHHVAMLNRLLLVADPIVVPVPDLEKKISILGNAVAMAHKLGDTNPRVAILAAVETVYPVMPHTIEAAAIAKMNERGQIKDCLIDGPLSMDVAVIESAAQAKHVTGQVAGRANVLIAPNIETAYGMNRAFSKYVGAPSGSLVLGGAIPYIVTSRWDSEETKANSLRLAMLQR